MTSKLRSSKYKYKCWALRGVKFTNPASYLSVNRNISQKFLVVHVCIGNLLLKIRSPIYKSPSQYINRIPIMKFFYCIKELVWILLWWECKIFFNIFETFLERKFQVQVREEFWTNVYSTVSLLYCTNVFIDRIPRFRNELFNSNLLKKFNWSFLSSLIFFPFALAVECGWHQ